MDAHGVYRLGVALLDLADPSIVLSRPERFVLEPRETWELKGDVPHVIFSCGTIVVNEELYVYYGAADRVVAVATCRLAEMIAFVTERG